MITLGTELAKQCDHHGLKNGQYQRRKREKKREQFNSVYLSRCLRGGIRKVTLKGCTSKDGFFKIKSIFTDSDKYERQNDNTSERHDVVACS